MAYGILGLDDILKIKQQLWDGKLQISIAHQMNIGESYVSMICSGRRYDYVPWPDGQRGALPRYRRLEINKLRRDTKAGRYVEDIGDAMTAYYSNLKKTREEIDAAIAELASTKSSEPFPIGMGSTAVPDIRVSEIELLGTKWPYVPLSEFPTLDPELQELVDEYLEDGWAAELTLGMLLARLPYSIWTVDILKENYEELLVHTKAKLKKQNANARALVKEKKAQEQI